jgi:hypothetical protein
LIQELKLRVRFIGVQIEDDIAQNVLAGRKLFANQDMQQAVDRAANQILDNENRHELMRRWEEEHPGKSPFPPPLARRIAAVIEQADPEDALDTLSEVLKMAQEESE